MSSPRKHILNFDTLNTACPKCGLPSSFHSWNVQYVDGLVSGEHLDANCARCGFAIAVETFENSELRKQYERHEAEFDARVLDFAKVS